MGCDIHAYIEFDPGWKEPTWLHYGRAFFWRNYELFGRMAGVRYTEVQHIKPKGFPTDADTTTRREYFLELIDDATLQNEAGYCSPECATTYVKYSGSYYTTFGTKTFVSHPDWHTASWLTRDEFDAIAKDLKEDKDKQALAVSNLMNTLTCPAVRIVFWFDN